MKCIEENTERLDFLQKSLEVEEKQKKRLLDISLEKKKEMEEAQTKQIYHGFSNSTMTMFDQEEAIRKSLVEDMIKTAPHTPTVKVLTNLQGNLPVRVDHLLNNTL